MDVLLVEDNPGDIRLAQECFGLQPSCRDRVVANLTPYLAPAPAPSLHHPIATANRNR